MLEVRRMVEADCTPLAIMGEYLVEEAPNYNRAEYDWKRAAHRLRWLMQKEDCLCLVAYDTKRERLAGLVVVYIGAESWVQRRYVQDDILFLHPDYRCTLGSAKVLREWLRRIERWASRHNISETRLGITSGIQSGKVARTYGKLGYQKNCLVMVKHVRRRVESPGT